MFSKFSASGIRVMLVFLPAVFCYAFTGKCQQTERFNSFSYNVNEGLLQSHVNEMAFDKNNNGWLSFVNGIQKFDGQHFTNIPVQPGLPDDKETRFFVNKAGDLLIAHSQGISKYAISNNKFTQFYKSSPAKKASFYFVGEDDGKIYLLNTSGMIIVFDALSLKLLDEYQSPLLERDDQYAINFRIPRNDIVDHKLLFYADSCFMLYDLPSKKIVERSPKLPRNIYLPMSVTPDGEVSYFIFEKNTLCNYNFKTGRQRQFLSYGNDGLNKAGRASIKWWKNRLLFSFYSNLYEIDPNTRQPVKELVNFQNEPFVGPATIDKFEIDHFGNLYLLTINAGFRKVISKNYPIKYFGTSTKEFNFYTSVCIDKKANRIMAGSYGNGLLIYDTLQKLQKHIPNFPGETTAFTPTGILRLNDGSYILFLWGITKLWKMSADLNTLEPLYYERPITVNTKMVDYYSSLFAEDENTAQFYTRNFILIIDKNTGSLRRKMLGAFSSNAAALQGKNYIFHDNDELVFVDTASMQIIKKVPLKYTGGVRCLEVDANRNIYAGTNKGVFKMDPAGKQLFQIDRQKGLPDECIYAMAIDKQGYLWCSTNKGLVKIDGERIALQLNKEDGLQENEFNSNVVNMTPDGELYFGGVNGISSFYPSALNSTHEKVDLFFTNIKINNKEFYRDTAVWMIDKMELSYNQNLLSFDFIAMADNNPGQYIYQYQMEGVDDEWIQNQDLQTVRYLLPPGKYLFKIYASRFFDDKAKPLQTITIVIHPPFWKTWWFRIALATLLTLGLVYAVNRYNRRKYNNKLRLLESEHKIQLERERISRDLHDSIGAYANVVIYKTDLLEKERLEEERTDLMRDLKFASKDIITSLRETIWALKKDEYAAQDCLLRIRNFIQPFNKYYEHIHFSVEGDAPERLSLHYTHALNLVRIAQEAVSNAIKHAHAKNILVKSSVDASCWTISVIDDGSGFNPEDIDGLNRGNGLENMKQRAIDSNFQLTITSAGDKGTAVTVVVNC